MGSPDDEPGRAAHEGPRHEVVLSRPFCMGVHDVTVGQFKEFVKVTSYRSRAEIGGGSWRPFPDGDWRSDPQVNWQNPSFEQSDDHPVVCVSWNDAKAFCEWLSNKEGKKYTWLTEAQWEYACRAGSRSRFSFGDDGQEIGRYCWYKANSARRTHPVGQKDPNSWGLYDLEGNVAQWTADWYASDYYQISPKENASGA
jgi:formylglycine-generating enzyme required for sulfatase activity